MKSKRNLPIYLSGLVLFSLLVSACGMLTSPTVQPGLIETAAAATVSARLTEMTFSTLVAKATQFAQATPSLMPAVNTATQAQPAATNTQVIISTNTQAPPANTPIPPTKTPVPLPCNWAGFVKDVTVPDGTVYSPDQTFTKTWRLVNQGTCTWTENYEIIFAKGNAMSAPAAKKINKVVKPGETVDISLDLTAPHDPGLYQGDFKLRSNNGITFGIGYDYVSSFYVKIEVKNTTPADPNTVYDFVGKACDAEWSTEDGDINCPSASENFNDGSVQIKYGGTLEGGYKEDEPLLITIPADGNDNVIRGQYPAITIKPGYHFKSVVGCMDKSSQCKVKFVLRYKEYGDDTVITLDEWVQKSDGSYASVDVDLAALDGLKVVFYLKVENENDDSTDDRAFWLAPRITK